MEKKNGRKVSLLICLAFLCAFFAAKNAAGETPVTDGVCDQLLFADIPVGDFSSPADAPVTPPQEPLYINQKYHTSYEEGYYAEEVWMYGHDGLDTEGESDKPGVNDVVSIQPGVVILSKAAALTGGWGESIIIATRTNAYSEEIITHHYHHLHSEGHGGDYATTRQLSACDAVPAGIIVGKEGTTGNSNGSHLHLSVRRWANMAELSSAIKKGGHTLFGYGYTFGDDAKMARNLDPEGLIFDTYRDYAWENAVQPDYAWSLPFVRKMRRRGIEFGLFDGRYGAGGQVKKREAARWLKIGAKLQNTTAMIPTFSDVPFTDPDSVYIEKLVRFPSAHPVFNPGHSCQQGAEMFCPDAALNRAEALKAVIMAFYGEEFIRDYDQNIWTQSYNLAVELLDIFTDVPVLAWYAPYVYFGANHGLVTQQDIFAPEEPVRREQMAKWIITGSEYKDGKSGNSCDSNACAAGSYCSGTGNKCVPIPSCVPSEDHQCEVGGGYQAPAQPPPEDNTNPSPACAAGYTPCQNDCCDNKSEVCFEGSACYCFNNFLDCGDGVCRDSMKDNANCGGCGNVCDPGKTCTNGFCIPGQQCECTSGTCCDGCHYKPDAYTASATQSCYGNPQGVGTPTLCLETQKVTGPNFRYRVCKQGGTFQNSFTYRLKDNNNLVNFTNLNGPAGASCTGWQNFEVSYLGYGASESAGLQAEIISPAGCAQASCKYKTGTITITKTCS